MLKLSVLLLVGSWLSCPRDFLHQKFTQLLSFSEIWHRREMETAFQLALYFITFKAMALANCDAL